MRKKNACILILFVQFFSLFTLAQGQDTLFHSSAYRNLRLWDTDVGRCFFRQETSNSCVPASVEMVLEYLDFSPLPNQTQLAIEMHTDINHPTKWRYVYIPFENRNFSDYYSGSFSDDFGVALSYLKGNISRNFPAIVNTWYDEQAKAEGEISHARVVTGYNSTGIFFHDPWSEPNRFLNYSTLSNLWKTDSGYVAFIVRQEPTFDLIVEIKDWRTRLIPEVECFLIGETNRTKVTNSDGIARFSDLTIAYYVLRYTYKLESEEHRITLTRAMEVSYRFISPDQKIFGIILITFIVVLILLFLKKQA